MYDSEFADTGGDILRQDGSPSPVQVRAVKQTCSILFVVMCHVILRHENIEFLFAHCDM